MSAAGHHRALAQAVAYLGGRQSYNGGFCFYRYGGVDEPNLHDTYHAVAALTLLGERVPRREELSRFLSHFSASGVHQHYYRAFALAMLGTAEVLDAHRVAALNVHSPDATDATNPTGWLEAKLRLLRLQRRFGDFVADSEILVFLGQLRQQEGGYGGKANLLDTAFCLQILGLLEQAPPPGVAAFVDRLQVPSFGFTLTEDSAMASVELVQAGLKCCALLGLPVRYPHDILGFTLLCQSADGGFARSPGALPDIEQTRRAVQVIARLASPPPA